MKNVYAYLRISDKHKQGDGVSLQEQKRILIEYAKANNLKIIHFYEEKKTAAKRGRPLFNEMMQNLIDKKADGVIIHKIDRGSRNLHDWADIGDLIDNDIEVYFAHENLNLSERGGRLSADIQAVMASDYVRNLRQEAIKGLYGRLKQGYYPWAAPIGYVNNGKGVVKTIHPIQGRFVKELFKLYVSKNWNVRTLAIEMEKRGLRNSKGNRVCKNGITKILKNTFYIGLMQVRNQTFQGKHKPLISTRTFKQAQLIIEGRQNSKGIKHDYLFRRMLRCDDCNYVMSGEMQKGMVYYRCHTKGCPTKSIREDVVEGYIENMLKTIELRPSELETLQKLLDNDVKDIEKERSTIIGGLNLQKKNAQAKESKLLDAYLENMIEKEHYENRKTKLLFTIQELNEKIEQTNNQKNKISSKIESILELCKHPLNIYQSGIIEEKREYLRNITSNLTAKGKGVIFSMLSPYGELANRDLFLKCPHLRDELRTMTLKIIYTDKNTSAVVPKAMNKQQCKEFVDNLIKTTPQLPEPNNVIKDNEL